jgi:hypothetical protein
MLYKNENTKVEQTLLADCFCRYLIYCLLSITQPLIVICLFYLSGWNVF